jgi:pimeloyl-ACP methyl ester carboxylesterase
VGFYSPIDFVPNVTAPALFVAADQDTLCPASVVRAASKLVGGSTEAEMLTLNCGHFGEPPFAPLASQPTPLMPPHRASGTYYDANFDQASEKMSSFFFANFDE